MCTVGDVRGFKSNYSCQCGLDTDEPEPDISVSESMICEHLGLLVDDE